MPAKIELEPLTLHQQSLVANNLGLAYSTINKFAMLSQVEREHLEEFCMIGMFRAAQTYDPNHPSGAQFQTHACWRLRAAVSAFFVWLNRQKRYGQADTISVEQITEAGIPNSRPFDVIDPYAVEPSVTAERRELLDSAKKLVTKRAWTLMREHFCEGRTYRELGHLHGISTERCRQIIVDGIERAREGVGV